MSNEDMIIKIITEEAKEIEANIISLFEITETGKKYAIYTFNEEDAQGLVKIYASKLVELNGMYTLESVVDSDEWSKVKEMMKDMAKDSSNYIKNGVVKLINSKEVKDNSTEPLTVKVSETKAAKIGPNYKSGITNNYSTNIPEYNAPVSSQSVTPEVTVPESPIPNIKPAVPSVEEESVPDEIEVNEPAVEEPEVEKETQEVEIPNIPEYEPSIELPKIGTREEKFNPIAYEKELPTNVDSILNKASSSYYQREGLDIDTDINDTSSISQTKENIIQTIGLEFMSKVSELAEYEKDLKRREKEIEMRERGLIKIEKEITDKESKYRELDFKRREKEISDKEADLNRKVLEFNKKITMFQQSFGLMSGIE